MCGRFTFATAPTALVELLGLDEPPTLDPRYNIAPTQALLVVRAVLQGETRRRELRLLRWGLVPPWADDPSVGYRMINARSETAASKPAFRAAFRRRRCLVLADGFFEWKRVGRGPKQPHYLRLRDGRPFAFAGLWERWRGPGDPPDELLSCTLLTCAPNELVATIHDRMPVILPPAAYEPWLDPEQQDPAALQALLAPYPAEEMIAYPVGTGVNNPRFDDPSLIAPYAHVDGGGAPGEQTELPLGRPDRER